MSSRRPRDWMFLQIAKAAAQRGSCLRLSVGAVVVKDSDVVSLGYVGAPAGQPHCDESNCRPDVPCTRTIHAEMNAIGRAAKRGKATEGATLYSTYSPCLDCAKVILAAGISEVVFDVLYRIGNGTELLRSNGIVVRQYEEHEEEDPPALA